jgi:hypothetical protein
MPQSITQANHYHTSVLNHQTYFLLALLKALWIGSSAKGLQVLLADTVTPSVPNPSFEIDIFMEVEPDCGLEVHCSARFFSD